MNNVSRLLLLTAVLIPTLAMAERGGFEGHGGERGPGGRILAAIGELDATAEQKQKIATVLKANRGEMRAAMEHAREAREGMFVVIQSDTFNESEVRAAYKKVAAAEEDLAVLRAKSFSAVRSILTAEQHEKLAGMWRDGRQKFQRGFKKGRRAFDQWIDENAEG